ncbi:MAG: hypothetical protein ISS74_06675 [Planctomycetes bacterium]|nr:hypothetical protein [Planctomycetota bacterium]
MTRTAHLIRTGMIALLLALALAGAATAAGAAATPPDPSRDPSPERWAKQVEAYEARDAAHPPPEGVVVFAGSSTIRMWPDLEKTFAPTPVLGRGIGGSHISDQVHWAGRLVLRYRPRQVVFYAGDNDVAGGKKAERLLEDFKRFIAAVRKGLPEAWIHFLAIKPSVKREALWPEMAKANRLVTEFAKTAPRVTYIDVATPLLDAGGRPRPDLFVDDMLHMNAKGYALWVPLVRAAIEKAAREKAVSGEAPGEAPGGQSR